ncbi:hypothetical protein ACLOJK_002584, partial [Asimina triloba]
ITGVAVHGIIHVHGQQFFQRAKQHSTGNGSINFHLKLHSFKDVFKVGSHHVPRQQTHNEQLPTAKIRNPAPNLDHTIHRTIQHTGAQPIKFILPSTRRHYTGNFFAYKMMHRLKANTSSILGSSSPMGGERASASEGARRD